MFGVQAIFERLEERLNDHHCDKNHNNKQEAGSNKQ